MNIVERLKDSLEYEYNLNFSERKQLLEEIERLNNIINGLEKYLEEESKYNEYVDLFYREHMGNVLDILKKLKENNK